MLVSQNGWSTLSGYSDSNLTTIPKIIGKVRKGPTAEIFTDLVQQFDATVESVDLGEDDWGFAPRAIRGGTTPSNHASGTAIDLNATRHGLGRVGTFTPAQVAAIRRMLARYEGVVRWGGDYAGRKDEMHFEIIGNAARIAEVAKNLKTFDLVPAGGVTPAPPAKPGAKTPTKQRNNTPPNGGTTFPTDYEDLVLDRDPGLLTGGALQILLRNLGHRNNQRWDGQIGPATTRDLQERLRMMGYYIRTPWPAKGVPKGTPLQVDGGDGYWFWVEMQRMLRDRNFYTRDVDGDPKGWTVEALQRWLNSQNG